MSYTQTKSAGLTPETKKEYTALLDKSWSNLAGAIDAIGRIQVMAQKDFVGDSGLLYTLVSQPESYSLGKRSLVIAGLISLLLALVFSALYTLSYLFIDKALTKTTA